MSGKQGFDEFVATRSVRLMRTARLLTRNWATAEDLVQDAMTKAWFAWSRVEGDPEAYVRRIIVTTYISHSRRLWRNELPSDDLPEHAGADPYGRSDSRLTMLDALDRLPPRQRAVIVLRYYEDLSDTQISAVMHCSVGTVKSQAAKALAKLRVDDSLTDGTDITRSTA